LKSEFLYWDNPLATGALIYTFEFFYPFGPNSTLSDMITELNSQWYRQLEDLAPPFNDDTPTAWYAALNDPKVKWRLDVATGRVALLGMDGTLDYDISFENHPDPDQSEIF
jgi:hypothetical protein